MSPWSALKVLLIDADALLCSRLREFCATRGIVVECQHDGRRGLARALQDTVDVVLLDMAMPHLDGLELLHQLRRRSAVPVIVMAASGVSAGAVTALDSGADDFLPKPFAPAELVARVRAVVRRREVGAVRGPLSAGGLLFCPATRRVSADGRLLDITATEYEILECLVRSAGRIVSRDELMAAIGRRPASPLERSVDVHISRLRRKLDDRGARIRSVRGVGYVFCFDVGQSSSAPQERETPPRAPAGCELASPDTPRPRD
jgi:two-component system response regulator CpxR